MRKKQTAVVASEASPVQEPAEERLCLCGCGEPVNREFRPGHDQRLKGVWLRAHDAGDKEATESLLKRGWATEFSLEERAEKATKRAMKAQVPAQGVEVKEDPKGDAGDTSEKVA